MASIQILYSSHDGHTLKICQQIQSHLISLGNRVSLDPIANVSTKMLAEADKLVIGAAIRYGSHGTPVLKFIRHNHLLLSSKPAAFFSVNLVARKPDKNQPETNPYLSKFLKRIPWQPNELAVFAGKLDYPGYRPWDRWLIRLIMLMTGGPTDPNTVVEFTDWSQVESFAETLHQMPD